MLQPLTLGKTTFPVNIIQGPLAGISNAPFRLLTWRYSQPAYTCTEMISCKTIIHQPDMLRERFGYLDPNEGPVCFQLSTNNVSELAEAVKRVTDLGAAIIDLNCGCPVKKIRSKGAGSSLLSNPSQLHQLITAMKQSTHLPVTIKIRVQQANEDVANAISDAGADAVIVHGRHWTEHYETPCRHDAIHYFVERMKIPVIGNGDIACIASLKKMFATNCAGVMIGRAGVGQPWLIAKLIAEARNENFTSPSQAEIYSALIEHVTHLAQLLKSEKFAILQARKFAKYYGRQLADRAAFATEVNACDNLEAFTNICQQYFTGV